MSRLTHIIRKELIQTRRDPMMARLIIVVPILQLVIFGYAATNDVRNVPVAICDADHTADSRLIVEEIAHSYYFHVVPTSRDPRDLERLLLAGTAQIGVYIPRDFRRTLMRGQPAAVGVYVDGTDANTAGLATAYLTGILQQRALRFQVRDARKVGAFGDAAPQLRPEPRVWYNIELTSANFMVPGILGMILLVLTVNLGALSLVRERENGTLEQLMVTPLRSLELILGKMIPFLLLGMVETLITFALARGWFHTPFHGSLLVLLAMAFVFLFNTLGLGLLISAISRTQQEAQLVAFLFIMPSVLLSGFMFPIPNMPVPIQYLTYVIPFRYFLEIARGVFLRGAGPAVLWPQMLTLTLFGMATFGAGIAAFRKRL
jgi:ABC-2 type transport system permease protein